MVDDGRQCDWYTISSPCEPKGSGELKNNARLTSRFRKTESPLSHGISFYYQT